MRPRRRTDPVHARAAAAALLAAGLALAAGCQTLIRLTDEDVSRAIRRKQVEGLGVSRPAPLTIPPASDLRAGREAISHDPTPQRDPVPQEFLIPASAPSSAPLRMSEVASQPATTSAPVRFRAEPLTLIGALRYADEHRRLLTTAKEDLYLVALRLTLERHLWTPQFSAQLRTVYGNYGQAQNFNQAMRFVADLQVAQRLPFGGQFTAQMLGTLIRDVGRSITAQENGQINMGLQVPFLRGAGLIVAQEQLIQLERSLVYAVREYEDFRRRQLVLVAGGYFDLVRSKQNVLDAITSEQRAADDYERAKAMEKVDVVGGAEGPLDTERAAAQLLSRRSQLNAVSEDFRFATDNFKFLIGMPVDDPIGRDDIESIDEIQTGIDAGTFPLLQKPLAAENEKWSLDVAARFRLDVLTAGDQIDDARRGVVITKNALLPNLDWTGNVAFNTDPNHSTIGGYDFAQTTWRTEIVAAMNDRFAEKNAYRASIIDVQRAERRKTDALESMRIEVRRSIHQIVLQDEQLALAQKNVEVSNRRREYARIRFLDGDLSNRDLVEAEDEWARSMAALNFARTAGWTAILEYRRVTGTLRVDEGASELSAEPY